MTVFVLERVFDETDYSEIESIYKTFDDAKEDMDNWACVIIGEEFKDYEYFDYDISKGQMFRTYYLGSPRSINHKIMFRITEWEVE